MEVPLLGAVDTIPNFNFAAISIRAQDLRQRVSRCTQPCLNRLNQFSQNHPIIRNVLIVCGIGAAGATIWAIAQAHAEGKV